MPIIFSLFSSCPFSLVLFTCIVPLYFLWFPSSFPFNLLYFSEPIFLPCASPLLVLFTYFRSPLRSSFFAVLLGFLSCYVHKKYMHSGFVPFSFRPRSGPVSFSFPFRSSRVLVPSPFRFLFLPAAFRPRLLFIPVTSPFVSF